MHGTFLTHLQLFTHPGVLEVFSRLFWVCARVFVNNLNVYYDPHTTSLVTRICFPSPVVLAAVVVREGARGFVMNQMVGFCVCMTPLRTTSNACLDHPQLFATPSVVPPVLVSLNIHL